jgi:UTP--glucose-1-phosphate uridylyltransferase
VLEPRILSWFAPVKTTDNLLVVRSDAYELADDWTVRLAPGRDAAPIVELSDEFKLLRDFEERFAGGPPSLVEAERLEVEGDVRFGSGVKVRGRVHIDGPAQIPDGAVLEG